MFKMVWQCSFQHSNFPVLLEMGFHCFTVLQSTTECFCDRIESLKVLFSRCFLSLLCKSLHERFLICIILLTSLFSSAYLLFSVSFSLCDLVALVFCMVLFLSEIFVQVSCFIHSFLFFVFYPRTFTPASRIT